MSDQRSLSTMATKTTPGKRLLDPLSCRPRNEQRKGKSQKGILLQARVQEKGSTRCSFRRGKLLERAATEGLALS